MKLLFTIPHYYKAANGSHGSVASSPQRRIHALTEVIFNIRQLFSRTYCEINIARKQAIPVNPGDHRADIVICTTGDDHLIDQLPIPKSWFTHHPTQAEPLMLGFECHQVLAKAIGHYDYYCSLEDDIVIQDALFFEKLNQFNRFTEVRDLLQPNRYELSLQAPFVKAYVDGDIRPQATQAFQDVTDQPVLKGQIMGSPVQFKRAMNPHSGCFFLNDAQLQLWVHHPSFMDRDVRFISPLESAASLGIMKTFRVYKPTLDFASFLEVRHQDNRFIQLIGKQVAIAHGEPQRPAIVPS